MVMVKPPGNAPGTSLAFITVGAIIAILCGTSYFYFGGDRLPGFLGYLRLSGLILGIVLVAIGLGVGQFGRQARRAEQLPEERPIASEATAANGAKVQATTNPPSWP